MAMHIDGSRIMPSIGWETLDQGIGWRIPGDEGTRMADRRSPGTARCRFIREVEQCDKRWKSPDTGNLEDDRQWYIYLLECSRGLTTIPGRLEDGMSIIRLAVFTTAIFGALAGALWWTMSAPVPQPADSASATAVDLVPAVPPIPGQVLPAPASAAQPPAPQLPATVEPVAAIPPAAEPDVVGSTPSIPGDANANLRSVVAAARSGANPERLTPLIAPAPYDHQRFLADPQAYLDVVEPGRVFQSAEPGEAVPQLELVGNAIATIPQGGRTDLVVRTVPGAPTTFTSFECGAFANQLTSITVRADAGGLATATFSAPPGTLNDVSILAGSPLASGQVNFCVTVTPAVAQQAPAVQ
jgi:hypothetical protein